MKQFTVLAKEQEEEAHFGLLLSFISLRAAVTAAAAVAAVEDGKSQPSELGKGKTSDSSSFVI